MSFSCLSLLLNHLSPTHEEDEFGATSIPTQGLTALSWEFSGCRVGGRCLVGARTMRPWMPSDPPPELAETQFSLHPVRGKTSLRTSCLIAPDLEPRLRGAEVEEPSISATERQHSLVCFFVIYLFPSLLKYPLLSFLTPLFFFLHSLLDMAICPRHLVLSLFP